MSEFKYGDMVLIQDLGDALVLDCGHDGVGPWVEVITKGMHVELVFSHDSNSFGLDRLTLIARPQAVLRGLE